MALIECIECKQSISDKAKACPKCGAPSDLTSCFECGKAVRPEAAACGECGAPNEAEVLKETESPEQKHPQSMDFGHDLASLRFRQPRHMRNKERSRLPLIIGLVIVAGAAYWLFGDASIADQSGETASAATSARTGQSSKSRSNAASSKPGAYVPSWANKSNQEKDHCFQFAGATIRVYDAQVRFIGQQRAADQAMSHIRNELGQWCLEYWAYASQ